MKKLLSMLMAVAMVLSLVVVPVAAEADYALQLADASGNTVIEAEPGTTVDVYLSTVGAFPGYTNIGGYVSYPEGWTVAVEDLFFLPAYMAGAQGLLFTNEPSINPMSVVWTTLGDKTGKVMTYTGDLAKLTFTIPENAKGEYTIGLDTAKNTPNYAYAHDASGVITSMKETVVLDIPAISCTIKVKAPEVAFDCPEHGAATWAEFPAITGGALTGGHYKLSGDVTLASALTVAAGETVCIDLAGNNITAPKKNNVRVLEIAAGATVTVTDSVGTGVISGGQVYNSTGDVVTEKFGGNIFNEGTFNLYGGTISGGYAYTSSTYYPHVSGGNIYGAAGSVTNIKGGTVKDGKVYKPSSYSSGSGVGGGNIFSEGTVNISGGTISGGKLDKAGSVTHENARNNYYYGGNIRMRGGELNISGGTITGGNITGTYKNAKGGMTACIYGGNIYTADTTVTISGGEISDGLIDATVSGGKTSKSNAAKGHFRGGNVCVAGGTLAISGGTISGGKLMGNAVESVADSGVAPTHETYGANLAIMSSAKTTMTGGLITQGHASKQAGAPGNDIYGGNVAVYGEGTEFTMTGGVLSEGLADYRGGNLALVSGGIATISGEAVIRDGILGALSGSRATEIAITGVASKLYIQEGAQILNKNATNSLSTVYAITNAKMYISGGKIQGAICTAGTAGNPNAELHITGGEFDKIEKSSVVPLENVTIGVGASYLDMDCLSCVTGEVVVKDPETSRKTVYATLADGLNAAANTAKAVILVKDVAVEGDVDVYSALNLYGHTLTATGVIDASNKDAAIYDSIGDGAATGADVKMHSANGMIGVDAENNGVVKYENVEAKQKLAAEGDTAFLKFIVDKAAADTLLDEAILAGSDVQVQITVTSAAITGGSHTFVYEAAMVNAYAENWDNKMFTCSISGLSELGEYTITAEIVSENVVVAATLAE